MTIGLYRRLAITFIVLLLAGGCTSVPQYQALLQWNPDDFDYTLWIRNESGEISSMKYKAGFSYLLKATGNQDGSLDLERLEEGEAPVFFDLFRNGKRYLLIQDSGGIFHLRVLEFDADGWRQIYYGRSSESPQLRDIDGDGRFEFPHEDFFSSTLPPVCGDLYGFLILSYSNGKLLPDRKLNRMPPVTPEKWQECRKQFQAYTRELETNSDLRKEDIEAHFVKSVLIDLLYEGNWNQSDEFIQALEYDSAAGEQLKKEILTQVRNSPYHAFLLELNRGN